MHHVPTVAHFRTALLFLLIIFPVSLFAQSIWTERPPGRSFTVEFLQPNFDGTIGSSGNFALFFNGCFPAWENTRLILDLPVARGSREGSYYFSGESNTIVGNPLLGVEIRRPGSKSFAEIGIRFPITPNQSYPARSTGLISDYDRQEAFFSNVFTTSIIGNFLIEPPIEHSFMRLRFGPAIWMGGGNIEILLDYSLQVGYILDQVTLKTGISGRFLTTSEVAEFSNRFTHQFGVAGSVDLGRIQPGIFLRVPLDEPLSESIDYVLGLNVGFAFD